MTRIPVAKGVFTWPSEEPRLIGSRCAACAIVTFPAQDSCPRCASTEMAEHLLPRHGRLWAWTTQEFPPPSPPYAGPTGDAFVPFGVGYVELGGDQPRGVSADQPRGVSADQPRGVSADQPRGVSADQPRGVSADQPRGVSAEVKVEARLTEMEGLEIGMDMELVLVPFRTDADGNEVVTFAFRPVGGASSGV